MADHELPFDLADLNPSDVARMVGTDLGVTTTAGDSWAALYLPRDPFDMRGAA